MRFPLGPAPLFPADGYVEHHYRRNFLVNVLDGALFTLGLAFFSSSTVLPLYVRHLSDSPVLVSLVPAISQAGWFLPQLLTARRVEALARRLPFVMRMSANERFPVLFLGLSILLWPAMPPLIALPVFFALLTWQMVGGGLTAPGWVDLVARVIPVGRRGQMLGLTNFLGSAMGVGGAMLAGHFLRTEPFPRGFGLVFLTGAAAFLLSWAFLGLIREPLVENVLPSAERRAYWRALPAILRRQTNLRRYLLARIPGILGLMANAFFVIYAAKRFNLPDEIAGGYTAALMVSGMAANPLVGALGDRLGHKAVMETSLLAQALALVVALLAEDPAWFYVVFALQGASNAGSMIASVGIVMEFGAETDRPTITGLANTLQGIVFLGGPLLGGLIAGRYGYRGAFWVALAGVAVGYLFTRLAVTDPRHLSSIARQVPDSFSPG